MIGLGTIVNVAAVLIMAIGINVAFGKRFSPANMLPALLGPVAAEVIFSFV